MKMLIITSMLAIVSMAQAENESLLTRATAQIEDKFILLSQDCSTAYYIDNSYGIDASKTNISLTRNIKVAGADRIVTPQIHVRMNLKPLRKELTESFRSQVIDWANSGEVRCNTANISLRAYPNLMIQAVSNFANRLAGFTVNTLELQADGSLTTSIEINPKQVRLRDAVNSLNSFRPRLGIRKFEIKREAKVTLSLTSQLAAEFYQFTYNDRVCYSRQRCFSIGGWNSHNFCHDEEHCDEIPKISQAIKELKSNASSKLEIESEENLPEWKIDSIVDQLASRFIISNYTEQSRLQTEEVTTITLGVMKKDAAQEYHDELHTERLNEVRIEQVTFLSDSIDFLNAALATIYKTVNTSSR